MCVTSASLRSRSAHHPAQRPRPSHVLARERGRYDRGQIRSERSSKVAKCRSRYDSTGRARTAGRRDVGGDGDIDHPMVGRREDRRRCHQYRRAMDDATGVGDMSVVVPSNYSPFAIVDHGSGYFLQSDGLNAVFWFDSRHGKMALHFFDVPFRFGNAFGQIYTQPNSHGGAAGRRWDGAVPAGPNDGLRVHRGAGAELVVRRRQPGNVTVDRLSRSSPPGTHEVAGSRQGALTHLRWVGGCC